MAVIVYVGDRLYDDLTDEEKRAVATHIVRTTMHSFAETARARVTQQLQAEAAKAAAAAGD